MKAEMTKNATKYIPELEEKYPIGNSPLFPGKRVYENKECYWELTYLRLQIWAHAIVCQQYIIQMSY
jgi:hypothetical protein